MAFRDIGEINGDLAVIAGAIGPGSFFENLRTVDSKDRTVFLNDFGEVLFFPDGMTITLFIIGPLPKNTEKLGPRALMPSTNWTCPAGKKGGSLG